MAKTTFDSLLILLLAATVPLHVSRRPGLPCPAMPAGDGVVLALVPDALTIGIAPETALPAAALDTPPGVLPGVVALLLMGLRARSIVPRPATA